MYIEEDEIYNEYIEEDRDELENNSTASLIISAVSSKLNQEEEIEDIKPHLSPIGRDVFLNNKIEEETTRATTRENELEVQIAGAGKIDDVIVDGISVVVDKVANITLQPKIDIETNRATVAEQTLQTNINNEANTRANADVQLQTNINTEASVRSVADTQLQTNITSEATTRRDADTQLQTNIGNEASIRSTEDAKKVDKITDINKIYGTSATGEQTTYDKDSFGKVDDVKVDGTSVVTDKIANIDLNSIRTLISNEATTRGAADAQLQVGIENEEEARSDADDILQDEIDNLKAIGRFLSIWNCNTGLPTTEPTTTPYTYHTGDYFIVGTTGTTNYMPDGSSYTGVASTKVYAGEISVNDYFVYDGSTWKLLNNTQKAITFANITGQPTDNQNLATALNAKENISNKKTSISSTSTDTEYPSAKCVYDAIQAIGITSTQIIIEDE